jgi:hypothetical protein
MSLLHQSTLYRPRSREGGRLSLVQSRVYTQKRKKGAISSLIVCCSGVPVDVCPPTHSILKNASQSTDCSDPLGSSPERANSDHAATGAPAAVQRRRMGTLLADERKSCSKSCSGPHRACGSGGQFIIRFMKRNPLPVDGHGHVAVVPRRRYC